MARRRTLALVAMTAGFATGCQTHTPDGDAAPGPPIHDRISQPSIATCGACHLDAYREWEQSLHHRAWTNDNVRTATKNFTRESCRACHSPMPVLRTGLDRRPDFREANTADGVHCLSCHGREDGVAATRTIEGAPCRPHFDPRLRRAELCYPCHEPTHHAFTEYYQSDAFALGLRCADCHMQPRAGAPGHSHGPNGGLNASFVARAIGWRCWIENGEVRVELRNRTGHKFPGEIPSRAFLVRVDIDGTPHSTLLRKRFRGEKRADNRLTPDEVRVLRFPLGQARSARVRLVFQPYPLLPPGSGFTLADWRGEADAPPRSG